MVKVHALNDTCFIGLLMWVVGACFLRLRPSRFYGVVHELTEVVAEPVQTDLKRVKKGHSGRSQEEKVGRLKYLLQLYKEIHRDIEEIKLMQRTIFAGLKGLFNFSVPMIQKVACADEVDRAILDMLHEAGGAGLLPKELAARLTAYKVMRYQVGRRLVRMNRRLEKEFGERVVERRGWHWAMTSFGNEAWGETDRNSLKEDERLA